MSNDDQGPPNTSPRSAFDIAIDRIFLLFGLLCILTVYAGAVGFKSDIASTPLLAAAGISVSVGVGRKVKEIDPNSIISNILEKIGL